MAGLLGFLKRPPRKVLKAVEALSRDRIPVKIEIENSDFRYTTVIAVRRGMLVVAKPIGLGKAIGKGVFVRFKLPEWESVEVRAQVITPNFSIANGVSVFLCELPKQFVEGVVRVSARYNTAKYNNLLLTTGDMDDTDDFTKRYRVINLSATGCRIFCRKQDSRHTFPVGESIAPTVLHLGNRIKVELETLTPRVIQRTSVGLEFTVSEEGLNMKYFDHLMVSLERSESSRLKEITM